MSARIRIGTQGWNYDAWVGPVLSDRARAPPTTSPCTRAPSTRWRSTPPSTRSRRRRRCAAGTSARRTDFTFALKLPQEITHERRLRDADDVAELFFDRARELGDEARPGAHPARPRLRAGRSCPRSRNCCPKLPRDIRFGVEFRQRGWIHDGVLALLAEHDVALALTDARWIPRKQMLALADAPDRRLPVRPMDGRRTATSSTTRASRSTARGARAVGRRALAARAARA